MPASAETETSLEAWGSRRDPGGEMELTLGPFRPLTLEEDDGVSPAHSYE